MAKVKYDTKKAIQDALKEVSISELQRTEYHTDQILRENEKKDKPIFKQKTKKK